MSIAIEAEVICYLHAKSQRNKQNVFEFIAEKCKFDLINIKEPW